MLFWQVFIYLSFSPLSPLLRPTFNSFFVDTPTVPEFHSQQVLRKLVTKNNSDLVCLATASFDYKKFLKVIESALHLNLVASAIANPYLGVPKLSKVFLRGDIHTNVV